MTHLFRIGMATGLALVATYAFAGGGDHSLVSPGQPHAIISTAQPPGPNYYRAKIVWLDGNYLSNLHRNTFWVKPGRHKIGFSAIINASRGPAVMLSPAMSSPRNMPTLTLNLKQGYSYYFAVKIPKSHNPSQWKPVVIKTIKGH
jgi:hypothetical protein